MKSRTLIVISFLFAVFASSAVSAQSDLKWIDITDPAEVRELIRGKVADGKYFMDYYRSDGNMVFYYAQYDSMSIRKWKIEDDGRMCMSMYSKPDKLIDCVTYQRTSVEPTKYRMKSRIGVSAFEFFDEPPEKLSKALNDAAGAGQ